MARKCIAVLEIGSSKMTCIVGSRGASGIFEIAAQSQFEYAGFMEGEFLEPEALKGAISQVVTNAQTEACRYITHLYVGVPAEFSLVSVRSSGKSFTKPKKVTTFDVDELFEKLEAQENSATHVVVGSSPVCFELSDKRKVIDVVGEITTSFAATLSFVLAERSFVSTISKALDALDIPNIEFVSEPLAECMFVVDTAKRDEGAILIDCGYITTGVAIAMGDGLVALNSFSLGGGHLSGDLYKCLEIPFNVCENLKRKIVLNVQPEDDDYYQVVCDGETHKVNAKQANDIVLARLEQIAGIINQCIEASNIPFEENKTVLLTGGGISLVRGARDRLSKYLGRRVEVVAPVVPELNKPNLSAAISLLNFALDQAPTVKLNIFKFFNKK